jgi:spermidine synthase
MMKDSAVVKTELFGPARRRARYGLACLAALLAFSCIASKQPKVIYEKASPYNTIVVTEDSSGLRTLQFERNGARQSVVKIGDPGHIELPYVRTLLVSLALIETPNRVLVIGLGGGTVPMFLRKHYPQATIDAVDIDPDVVEVAKTLFGFQEDERLRAHVSDGRKFIEAGGQPYDLIVLDAYGSDNIPYHLATREFLDATRLALAPGGVVAANVWGRVSNPLYDSMMRTYRDAFEQVQLLDVSGANNVIVLALARRDPIRRNDLISRAQTLAKERQFSFDLGATARFGLRPERREPDAGRILRDKR